MCISASIKVYEELQLAMGFLLVISKPRHFSMIFIKFLPGFQHETRFLAKIIEINLPESNFFSPQKSFIIKKTLNILTKIYMDFLWKRGLFSHQFSPADRSYVCIKIPI